MCTLQGKRPGHIYVRDVFYFCGHPSDAGGCFCIVGAGVLDGPLVFCRCLGTGRPGGRPLQRLRFEVLAAAGNCVKGVLPLLQGGGGQGGFNAFQVLRPEPDGNAAAQGNLP